MGRSKHSGPINKSIWKASHEARKTAVPKADEREKARQEGADKLKQEVDDYRAGKKKTKKKAKKRSWKGKIDRTPRGN